MPETIHEFTVAKPPQEVAGLIFHAAWLGTMFHPVQRTEGDATKSEWFLKTPFRATLGTSALRCTIEERTGNSCRWKAEADYLIWEGRFHLEPSEGGSTRIRFALRIEDNGPLATVHNAMIAVQIKNVTKFFERRLREALGEETTDA